MEQEAAPNLLLRVNDVAARHEENERQLRQLKEDRKCEQQRWQEELANAATNFTPCREYKQQKCTQLERTPLKEQDPSSPSKQNLCSQFLSAQKDSESELQLEKENTPHQCSPKPIDRKLIDERKQYQLRWEEELANAAKTFTPCREYTQQSRCLSRTPPRWISDPVTTVDTPNSLVQSQDIHDGELDSIETQERTKEPALTGVAEPKDIEITATQKINNQNSSPVQDLSNYSVYKMAASPLQELLSLSLPSSPKTVSSPCCLVELSPNAKSPPASRTPTKQPNSPLMHHSPLVGHVATTLAKSLLCVSPPSSAAGTPSPTSTSVHMNASLMYMIHSTRKTAATPTTMAVVTPLHQRSNYGSIATAATTGSPAERGKELIPSSPCILSPSPVLSPSPEALQASRVWGCCCPSFIWS